jgi:hypothetical protein
VIKVDYPCGCELEARLVRYAIETEMAIFCAEHAKQVEKVTVEADA